MPHATERLLKHAPITEAVIDVQARPRRAFEMYVESLRSGFGPFFDSDEEQPEEKKGRRGLIFPANPTSEAVQVSEHGFAFSKLQPYTSWEEVRESARRYWEIYRSVVEVETIDRIGVRFINQFRLRHDQRLADYLTVLPQAPETVAPDEVVDTLSRLTILDDKTGISARVFYVCRPDESGLIVIIDIDAAKLGRFEVEDVWASLEQLRGVKNRIFFGSISETAAQEFDQ
jgi:uncharacterized protein (TIGR04255 family)